MSATEELRRLLDERGIEHDDEFVKSCMPYCDGYEGTYWGGDSFGYVEPVKPKPNTIGSHPELTIHNCTPEQALTATLSGRTCHVVSTYRYDYEGGYAGFEYVTELSCGHRFTDGNGDGPDYCPWCGAKVMDE